MDETGKEETIIFLCRQLMNSTEQVIVKHGHLEKLGFWNRNRNWNVILRKKADHNQWQKLFMIRNQPFHC